MKEKVVHMSNFEDYYQGTHKNAANSNTFECFEQDFDVFPREGVYIGELESVCGLKVPALIPLDQTNGLCFLSTPDNEQLIKKTMQMMALRLALTIPPGLCKFTLYDARNQGGSLIFLSYLNSKIIGERIITEPNELKEALINIKNSIPMIIQKVLGVKYSDKTLVDYNETAGELAKPYQFLILTDVPYSLNREIGEILMQIVKTGRKAGVFTIINFDSSYSPGKEYEYNPIPLLDVMTIIYEKGGRFYIKNAPNEDLLHRLALHLETEFPDPEKIVDVQDFINENLKKSQNVAISLADKFTEKNFWKGISGNGIEVPIGKVNATDVQKFELSVEDGRGQSYHHCLVGGSTGSGKTVLLHNIICNTAWLYSPSEVQFLLLDFKEGTEFMIYKDLPHVKVLSVKSEVEFAMNVFNFLDAEITQRGELFKSVGANNILKYNELAKEKLPRYIIVIDEFQKLFDDGLSLASKFADKISDIGKRGRSFGINMILSTQGLGGLNVGNSLSEFGLRICMRLNSDAECTKLLGHNNLAPRTLSKKGESVYCAGGNVKDNIIYQVAFLKDEKIKEIIAKMRSEYSRIMENKQDFCRFIFDGESRPNISENPALKKPLKPTKGKIRIYIGTPFALEEEHAYYTLQKENGYNVLLMGQDLEAATSVIYHSIDQIICQSSKESSFVICDKTNEDSPLYGQYARLKKKYSNVIVVNTDEEIETNIGIFKAELDKRRQNPGDYPRMVLAFHNLYNFRAARMKNGYSVSHISKSISEILSDGPDFGIHVILHIDTYEHCWKIFEMKTTIDEWRILMELKGGDGYRCFGNGAMKSTVKTANTINLHSAEMEDGETMKIKVYKL